jgi:crotonobetainyl-CoA:carnitine CoA-transferase CaiB-like acyl-CoA transferase
VNDIGQVFADAQVLARGMRIEMPHPLADAGTAELIGNPLKLSASPVEYRRPPPLLGQHTDEVLEEWLGLAAERCAALRAEKVI